MKFLKPCFLNEIPARHPVALFAEEWMRLQKEAAPSQWPLREAFRPFNHPRILEWLMLVEVLGDTDNRRYINRVVGTSVEALSGVKLQGEEYCAWMTPQERELRFKEIDELAQSASPLYSHSTNPHPEKGYQQNYRGAFQMGDDSGLTHVVFIIAPVDTQVVRSPTRPTL